MYATAHDDAGTGACGAGGARARSRGRRALADDGQACERDPAASQEPGVLTAVRGADNHMLWDIAR